MTDSKSSRLVGVAIWWLLFAGYWLALFVGTHLPPTFRGLPPQDTDKWVHFAAYAGLAFLLAMAWQHSTGMLNRRHLRFAWLAIGAFAAIDEITQLVVGRSASVNDWLADAAGAALGLVIFWMWQRWSK